jgi:hypothetical protein
VRSAPQCGAQFERDRFGDGAVRLGVDAIAQARKEARPVGRRQRAVVGEGADQVQVPLDGVAVVSGEPPELGILEPVGPLDAVFAGVRQVLEGREP